MPSGLSRSTLALVGAGLALLTAAVLWFVPYLTRDREAISSVPAPAPVVAVEGVDVPPHQRACIDEVALDTDSEIVELTALAGKRPGPPLEVEAEAEGYRARTAVDGGYERSALLRARLEPPERSAIGTLCIRNSGDRPVALLSTSDNRTSSLRSTTRVRGEPVAQDVSVRLLAAENGTVVDRADQLVERAAAFKPRLLGTAVIWLALLLVVGGVPAGALYALGSSFRGSDEGGSSLG
jgi:hypothetical protein